MLAGQGGALVAGGARLHSGDACPDGEGSGEVGRRAPVCSFIKVLMSL